MANDSTFEENLFDTEGEANAFTEGLDYYDNDHLSYESPYLRGDKWVVEVRTFV
jgi:hypothetical protein